MSAGPWRAHGGPSGADHGGDADEGVEDIDQNADKEVNQNADEEADNNSDEDPCALLAGGGGVADSSTGHAFA